MPPERFDHVVLGAGLRGLEAALRWRRERPDASLLAVDAAPRPGGSVRTQRSNGFVCELGPFAFAREEVEPLLALLARAPGLLEPLPGARRGARCDGAGLVPVDVAPLPVSFATGNEELPQACRRELGPALRLGRTAAALRPTADGVEIDLAGEAPGTLLAGRLTMALPLQAVASLLAPFDRQLPLVADRIGAERRAFVHLGGTSPGLRALHGYGIVAAEGAATPMAEAIFCTRVFPRRALGGRALVRVELAPPAEAADDDDALTALAVAELERWTGVRAAPDFVRVDRGTAGLEDAAAVECRARLRAITQQRRDLILPG